VRRKHSSEFEKLLLINLANLCEEIRLSRESQRISLDRLETTIYQGLADIARHAKDLQYDLSCVVIATRSIEHAIRIATTKQPTFFQRMAANFRLFLWNWSTRRQAKHAVNLKDEADKIAKGNPSGRWR
jgi:hypothetical protein